MVRITLRPHVQLDTSAPQALSSPRNSPAPLQHQAQLDRPVLLAALPAHQVRSAHLALGHLDRALQEQPVTGLCLTGIQICAQQARTSRHLAALFAQMTTTAHQVFTIHLNVPLVLKARTSLLKEIEIDSRSVCLVQLVNYAPDMASMANRLTTLSWLAQAITHPLELNSSNNLRALLASTQLEPRLTGISALNAHLARHAHKAQETELALRTL